MITQRQSELLQKQLPDDVQAKGYKQVRPYHHEQVFYSHKHNFEGTAYEFIQNGFGYYYQQIGEFRRQVIK